MDVVGWSVCLNAVWLNDTGSEGLHCTEGVRGQGVEQQDHKGFLIECRFRDPPLTSPYSTHHLCEMATKLLPTQIAWWNLGPDVVDVDQTSGTKVVCLNNEQNRMCPWNILPLPNIIDSPKIGLGRASLTHVDAWCLCWATYVESVLHSAARISNHYDYWRNWFFKYFSKQHLGFISTKMKTWNAKAFTWTTAYLGFIVAKKPQDIFSRISLSPNTNLEGKKTICCREYGEYNGGIYWNEWLTGALGLFVSCVSYYHVCSQWHNTGPSFQLFGSMI